MRPQPLVMNGLVNLKSIRGLDVNLERGVDDARVGEDAAFDDELRGSVVDDLLPRTPEARRKGYIQADESKKFEYSILLNLVTQ